MAGKESRQGYDSAFRGCEGMIWGTILATVLWALLILGALLIGELLSQ